MFLSKIIFSVTALVLIGALVGGITIGTVVQNTSTQEYCVSCHEMKALEVELKQTAHYKNASGVRATCADCHVPEDWTSKLWAKTKAVKDLYYHVLGKIDTAEEFEQHRLEMAQTVWKQMEKTDSETCRNCHSFSAMKLEKQTKAAQLEHKDAILAGQTCIKCHKGIAHKDASKPASKDSLKLEF
ncbi:MAG: NapC/NirT family cytochrome c [Gammaproteobacteria bacterium]|nr:NapC/NirT family cytochrome c [Gammaproteobacteria bacterium]MDH5692883.1 NapC/NirT family cytochrome c [Gammaproteobacteria bacterium]